MTKILFLVTQSEFGGAQRYIYEIIQGLDPEKYEFLVAAGEGDGELFQKISKLKTQNSKLQLKTQNLKYLKRVPSPLSQIQAVAEIYGLLKKEKPAVLFLCSTTCGLLGSIASFLYKNCNVLSCNCKISRYNLRTIYRIGGWAFRDPRPFWQNWIILLAEKITAPLKDKIIVNSEVDLQLALKYKIASTKKLIKIYNGIDLEKLDFLSREKARSTFPITGSERVVVGTVANFYKTKGLEYLIEAAGLLNSKFQISNFKFIIIGEGHLRPKLEAQIKKLNLENKVILVGRIPDAYKYLKAFDIFVLPSLKEGFPWVILEAMSAKIPIVATKVGALPEIIDEGIDGFLIKPKNSQAIAEKIIWFLNHPQKSQLMGQKAREKVEKKFTFGTMVAETEKLFF